MNGQLAPSSLRNISTRVCMQIKLKRSRKDEARLLLELHWGRMRGNRHRLEHREFWLGITEKFTLRVTSLGTSCSVRLSTDLEFKTLLDTAQSNLNLIQPVLSREQTKMTSRAPFWSELLYGSVKVILSIWLQIPIHWITTRMHRIWVNPYS